MERFLLELPDGSVGLDLGCGNGKYLGVNPKIFMVASDRSASSKAGKTHIFCTILWESLAADRACRSEALVKIAATHKSHSALVADVSMLPHPASMFDFAISVAVIHHLSTTPRRIQAIGAILETLRRGPVFQTSGKALIYVWALEQKQSRRGWDENDDQDVMVPWVMREKPVGEEKASVKTFHRYYHLYRSGELQKDILAAGGTVLECGYERDNWWAIAIPNSTCVTQPCVT